MTKWKRQKEKPRSFVKFLRFQPDETKELTVSDWQFPKNPSSYLFKCYVTKENGEEVDKVWSVWDYGSTQKLKKKLGVNYVSGSKELKVTMRKDEEEETYFEIS
ncbi:MAG: hypothetical protein ACOCZ6_00590 [Nanoarchaeota archaeon]